MGLQKRTYALPERTLKRFEERVPSGGRSAAVAELIQDWLDEQERAALRRDIIEGCRDMAEIDLETEREWHTASEELWTKLDA